MNVGGTPYRSIWDDRDEVWIIDQTRLPHDFSAVRLETLTDAARAIRTMQVRGAPLIGATAAWGMCLAMREDPSDAAVDSARAALLETRPTAVNLRWAVDEMRSVLLPLPPPARAEAAAVRARAICDEDVELNRSIGAHGLPLVRAAYEAKGDTVDVLTHCNAGWLATVDWGTALAPLYAAHQAGIPLHVWVDETRPRNQGAALTAWELAEHGIPHTVIVDNTGGHLMRIGRVDLCITGTDRTTRNGDVCNKIGTYLKALAARDNDVPFYVALPGPTIDWTLSDGADVPVEERAAEEVTEVRGLGPGGEVVAVRVTPPGSPALNYGFDVTPARLVTSLITERGVTEPSVDGLARLYPEHAPG